MYQTSNQGVGSTTLLGFQQALNDGADILVKLDGDGQMNPLDLRKIIASILNGNADYSKGNRFYNIDDLKQKLTIRLIGNAILSFVSKISTGYWHTFDPTNGYIAIHSNVFKLLPKEKISKRYFFKTDLLFRLNIIKAVVIDVPKTLKYADEISNLKIKNEIFRFMSGHILILFKRIFYCYFLRGFSIASLELVFGIGLFFSGLIFGAYEWIDHALNNMTASAGTVMLSALPFALGFQLILSFFHYDIATTPKVVIHKLM